MKGSIVFLLVWLPVFCASPETIPESETPFVEVPLEDLSHFEPVASNWQIVGAVTSDSSKQYDIQAEPGTGILVNIPSDTSRDNLFTAFEHADIELELDFVMPRGSNSGVYLQSRYEVQLFDSWGVAAPQFSDAGGIYQRWDETRPEGQFGFEGYAPRINASKPPGEWQHFRIVFQAPRFNEQGRKTQNARFVLVEHNGEVVHEDVEVTGPTRAAAFEDEVPSAPLMLQGDHGPVAFRNIRYREN